MHGDDKLPPPWLRHRGGEDHLLRDIIRTQQAIIGAFSREVGLPGARLALVRLLAIAGPDGAGVMDLSRELRVDAAAVTRQVASLGAAGLVVRRADARDKRRISVRLTPRGRRLFGKVHSRGHDFERNLTAEVAKADIDAALRVLAAVRAGIEKTRNIRRP